MTLARDLSNSFSLSVKRKRDDPESFVMQIRRTETSWLIQDTGDFGPVQLHVGPVPASVTPVPSSGSSSRYSRSAPLVFRKSGSSN
jgi:hypothetical protein